MKFRILSVLIFAAAATFGATQFAGSSTKAAAKAHVQKHVQACHNDYECPIHRSCDAGGSYWTEGKCW
jgi:hypothetical protein